MHGLRLVTTPARTAGATATSGWFLQRSEIPTAGIITLEGRPRAYLVKTNLKDFL